jgi:hypothetical protein
LWNSAPTWQADSNCQNPLNKFTDLYTHIEQLSSNPTTNHWQPVRRLRNRINIFFQDCLANVTMATTAVYRKKKQSI